MKFKWTLAAHAPLRITSVLLVVTLLVGCSMAGLVYKQADWLITDYVAELSDMDENQRKALAVPVGEIYRWHRQHALPDYAALLDAALLSLDGGLTEAETRSLYKQGRKYYSQLMGRLASGIAPALSGLRPAQIDVLENNLNARNEDFLADFADPDPTSRKMKRRERIIDRFEQFTGDLNDAQQAVVAERSDRFPDTGRLWLDYRIIQQIRLLGLLKEQRGAAAVDKHLRDWFADGAGRGNRLEQARVDVEQHITELIVVIVASLDREQLATLREEIESLRDTARELTAGS